LKAVKVTVNKAEKYKESEITPVLKKIEEKNILRSTSRPKD